MPNTGARRRGWCSKYPRDKLPSVGRYLAGTMWLVRTKGARPFGLLQRARHGATTFELQRGARQIALRQAAGAGAQRW